MSWGGAVKKREFLFWLVAILAVFVRLVHLLESGDDPSAFQPLVDSRTYHELAVGLAENGVLDEHFLWQAPLYPLLLAILYRLFGVSLLAVKLFQILLAGATCFLTMRLGRRIFDDTTALVAGILVAFCGPLLFFDQQLLATSLAVFWMITLANIVVSIQQPNQSARQGLPLFLGVVGALAFLTRPTFLPVVLLLVLWPYRKRICLKRMGLGLAGLLLVLVPFGMKMQSMTGHPGLFPPSGAINLFIGNNANFDETIGIRTGLPWENLISQPMQNGFQPGPWNGQPYFRAKVRQFVLHHPGDFLKLLVRKTTHLFSSRELPRNLDIYGHRQWSTVLSLLVFKVGPWGFPMALLWPLAAVGLMASGVRKNWLLFWMAAAYSLSLILVFTASRYRLPLLPLLCVFSAQGLVWLWGIFRQKNWPQLVPALAVFVVVSLLVTLPGPFAQEKSNLLSEMHYGVGWNYYQKEAWPEAEKELRLATLADPTFVEAHHFLGLTLVHQERWDEAFGYFQTAVRLKPDYSEAVHNLELCNFKRAEFHYRQGRAQEGNDPEGAIKKYRDVIGFSPDWPEVSVRLAWMLSTADDHTLRDGAKALELLKKPSLEGVNELPYVLYVKSAALAEVGQFGEAIEAAKAAKEKIGPGADEDLLQKINRALVLYETRQTVN